MKDLLTLRQLCEALGISRRTVQGYEAKKLVKPVGKNASGFLLYDPDTVSRIHTIRQYQSFGFTLTEIAGMDAMTPQEKKEKLISQRRILQQRNRELQDAIRKITELIEKI